jgi:hypothetical protein
VKLPYVASVALALLLGAQLVTKGRVATPEGPPTEIPSVEVASEAGPAGELKAYLTSAMDAGEVDCALLVLVSVHCGICKAWRPRWDRDYTALSNSAGVRLPSVWLAAEPIEQLELLLRRYQLEGVDQLSVAGDGRRAFARLGARGTPTTYVVHRSGRVVGGSIGAQLPTATAVSSTCGPS